MPSRNSRSGIVRWAGAGAVALVVYVLSSGPLLSTAFWLRNWTGRDEFYGALWLYAPMAFLGPDSVFAHYVEWWCELLGTVGPG